jgi:Aspartate/tyrosine/aromatic aminotransferase
MLSNFVKGIDESVTLATAARASALKEEGRDVLLLTVGQPDFTTPKHIEDRAIEVMETGRSSFYTPASGLPILKKAIASYMDEHYGFQPNPNEIIVTSGAKFAIYAFFMSVLNPEDEVIIPCPYWVSYADQVKMAGGEPVFVNCDEANDFKLTLEQVEKARTDKTKVLLINSPSNPTGMLYSQDELRILGEWAVKHNILILSDDIYHRLVYNGNYADKMAAISPEIREKTVVINGISKTYAMTGWRIGFAVGPEPIISAMSKIASQTTSNPATIAQYAAIEALTGNQDAVEKMRVEFENRLNTIYPLLEEIPGFKTIKPQGAFYFFPDVSEAMELSGFSDVTDFTNALLEEEGVAIVTGAGFGSPNHVRLSYATDMETLKEAVKRIKHFMNVRMRDEATNE